VDFGLLGLWKIAEVVGGGCGDFGSLVESSLR
jgi:hypothetical protein